MRKPIPYSKAMDNCLPLLGSELHNHALTLLFQASLKDKNEEVVFYQYKLQHTTV